MKIIIFCFICFWGTTYANIENDLIVDYFDYKNIVNVVGFSCNLRTEDFLLVKKLNQVGIAAIISNANDAIRINRLAYTIYQKLGIFVDLRCYNTNIITSLFSEAGYYSMYDDLHHWFVIGSNLTSISKFINDRAFGYSTNFITAILSTTKEGYELYDVYNLWKERGTKLNIQLIGFWKKTGQINISTTTRFVRRANLSGLPVRASFYDFSDTSSSNVSLETHLKDYGKIESDNVSKFGYVIITHLAEMLNFKVQCKLVSKWEKDDPIGPTVRAIINEKCDITGTPVIITQKRLLFIKYLYNHLMPFRSCFIFRSPQPNVIKANEILGPLHKNVWFLSIATIVACTFIFTLVLWFEEIHRSIPICFLDSVFTTIGALCLQGTDVRMNLISTRSVYFFITLFSFLLYNYYAAIIVSIRLNEPIFKLNDSLVTLAKSDLKFSSDRMQFFELFIKKKDWDIQYFYNVSWKNIPKNEQFLNPEKGLPLVKKGGYAYHVIPDNVYPYINQRFTEREICELTEVHLQKPIFIDLGVSCNSTIVEMLRVGISRIVEVGLCKRQVIRWKSSKPKCNRNALSASSINLYEFAPHLIILIFGMTIATVAFALEFINFGVK